LFVFSVLFGCSFRVFFGIFNVTFGNVMKWDDTEPLTGAELQFIRVRYGLSLHSAAKLQHTTRHYLKKVEAGDKPLKIIYAKRYEQIIGPKWFRMLRKQYHEQKEKKPSAHVPGLNDHIFEDEQC
jgi:hypothetical protein